jgi:hypothetical protein
MPQKQHTSSTVCAVCAWLVCICTGIQLTHQLLLRAVPQQSRPRKQSNSSLCQLPPTALPQGTDSDITTDCEPCTTPKENKTAQTATATAAAYLQSRQLPCHTWVSDESRRKHRTRHTANTTRINRRKQGNRGSTHRTTAAAAFSSTL